MIKNFGVVGIVFILLGACGSLKRVPSSQNSNDEALQAAWTLKVLQDIEMPYRMTSSASGDHFYDLNLFRDSDRNGIYEKCTVLVSHLTANNFSIFKMAKGVEFKHRSDSYNFRISKSERKSKAFLYFRGPGESDPSVYVDCVTFENEEASFASFSDALSAWFELKRR